MNDNIFKRYYSKIENIYIPLPNFDFFHQASDLDGVDKKFVGRTRISQTLKNYLSCQKENSFSGSYLITGYRGMGKSSFVGKVIKEMIDEEESQMPIIKPFSRNKTKQIVSSLFIISPIIITSTTLILLSFINTNTPLFWCIVLGIFLLFFCIPFYYIYKGITATNSHRHIHYIHLNLGSEIKNERDVLALIAASIKEKFTSFLLTNYPTSYRFACYRFIASLIISSIALFIFSYGMSIIDVPGFKFLYSDANQGFLKSIFRLINSILVNIRNTHPVGTIAGFFVSLSIGAIIYRYIIRNGFIAIFKKLGKPIRTGQQIYHKLKELCERIDASIDEDNNPYGTVNTSILGFTFNQKRVRRYNKASTPEIEQQLIQIIQQVNNTKLLHSRFIIVLDELDKINLQNQSEKPEKHKYEMPEFSYNTNGFPGSGSARNKKECILALLGRLKYFVTTAQAKFVFLSGHELFDAHLADVSDREFSISSTFSGVINVESFFSSDSQVKDVTRMTEIYLIKMLMNEEKTINKEVKREEEKYKISEYHDKIYKALQDNNKDSSYYEQLEKTIVFIRQFITYLTFVSNGAPKKLNTFFEKYVISKNEYDERIKRKKEFNTINVVDESGYSENTATYYLAFGYYDQQKIGFIHYIAYPIFYTIISPSSEYGDKLLVASSFLIAHIYKHHSSGFSWRNLEYLPELLDSNRTPELRDFINSMFGYLGQMHITRITSGLYHYKFPLRLAEEISVFTKKSEEISAIFNFSLDDSRAVKQYYADLLAFHEKSSHSSPINMANIHHYLGDLHLANEEYTEAIGQFRIASDILLKEIKRNEIINDPQITSYVIRYMRAMLKLGLAYEKRNTLDSAYLVYNNLVIVIIEHRYVNDKDIPLSYKQEKIDNNNIDGWREKRLIFYLSNKEDKASKETLQNSQFIKQIRPELMDKEEGKDIYFWTYGHEIVPNFSEYLAPENLALIAKLSTFEELRLTYLPILAKLFAVEKQHTGGITKDNIKVAEAEFKNIYLFSNNEDKFMLGVDFFRKLGDILYYKNGNHDFYRNTLDNLFNIWGYNIKSDIFDCCYKMNQKKDIIENIIKLVDNTDIKSNWIEKEYNKEKFIKRITSNAKERTILKELDLPQYITSHWSSLRFCYERRNEKKALMSPCFACKYYNRSLIILGKKIIPNFMCSTESKALAFLNIIQTKDFKSQRQNEINQAALTLEAMGNVIFSCANKNDQISNNFIQSFCNYEISKKDNTSFKNLSQLEKAFLYYWAASEYHYKALNTKEGVQCVIKIMNLLATYYDGLLSRKEEEISIDCSNDPNIIEKLIETIETVFVRKAIQGIYSNKDFYNLQEIRKLKEALGIADLHECIPLGFLSCIPDIEELILAYYEIQIILSRIPSKLKYGSTYQINNNIISTLYHSISLTYLRCDSLIYNRIISLLFKANLNTYMLEKLFSNRSINRIVEIAKKVEITRLKDFLDEINDNTVNNIINCISSTQVKKENRQENIFDLIEFLITDSVFCLLQISELVSPTFRTTLFTNNFCAAVYNSLHQWNELKYKLEELYKGIDKNRQKSFELTNHTLIDDHLIYMQTRTYIREMAAKFERRALEMHTEGRSYQDFIDSFYILDDDLQNNTCQFYLALERYKINIGMISDSKEEENQKNSSSYDPLNYFKINQSPISESNN